MTSCLNSCNASAYRTIDLFHLTHYLITISINDRTTLLVSSHYNIGLYPYKYLSCMWHYKTMTGFVNIVYVSKGSHH
jgi:hypothetical protein